MDSYKIPIWKAPKSEMQNEWEWAAIRIRVRSLLKGSPVVV